jgi:hypothetical protein
MTDRRTSPQPNQDHDLLIELRTEMRGVRDDIQKLTDGTASRLTALENDHVTKESHQDHENRVRNLERDRDNLKGKYAIIAFLGTVLIASVISYLFSKLH